MKRMTKETSIKQQFTNCVAIGQAGFSLIELMVVVVISLLMSLAVFGVLSTSESKKRTTLASSDIDQAGGFALYVLDKQIRSAGTGFRAPYAQSYGCLIYANYNGTQILPPTQALPPEFAALTGGTSTLFRLAPILIAKNQAQPYGGSWNGSASGSDFIVIMSGSAGQGEVPINYTTAPTVAPAQLNLINTIGTSPNDILLQIDVDNAVTLAPANCMLESVSSAFTGAGTTTVVPLAGTYLSTAVGTQSLSAISPSGSSLDLGQNVSMMVYGVGNNTTLYGYDLLQGNNVGGVANSAVSQALASGVYEMKALYGIDTSGNGTAFSWVDPGTAPWDFTSLTNGTAASTSNMKEITMIRIGLVLRSALPENLCGSVATQRIGQNCAVIQQPNPTLFADIATSAGVSLKYTHTLTAAEQNYRFRTIEATIPLRNNLL